MNEQLTLEELIDVLRKAGIAPRQFNSAATLGVNVLAFDCTPGAELYLCARVTALLDEPQRSAFVSSLYYADVQRGAQTTVYFTNYRIGGDAL